MYMMFADEADQDGSREFLVYVAVFVPVSEALTIKREIESLRTEFEFPAGSPLKFSSGTRPSSVTREAHAEIKNRVLALAAQSDCKICCYLVPHSIAKGQDLQGRLKFAVNTLASKFDQFLRESGGVGGWAFFDRTTDYRQSDYLRELMTEGVDWSGKRKLLHHIIGMSDTREGYSHINSMCDIVVGAFRFIANEPDKDRVGTELMKPIAQLMWGTVDRLGKKTVRERGLLIRPRKVILTAYQADIQSFIERLTEYAKRA